MPEMKMRFSGLEYGIISDLMSSFVQRYDDMEQKQCFLYAVPSGTVEENREMCNSLVGLLKETHVCNLCWNLDVTGERPVGTESR